VWRIVTVLHLTSCCDQNERKHKQQHDGSEAYYEGVLRKQWICYKPYTNWKTIYNDETFVATSNLVMLQHYKITSIIVKVPQSSHALLHPVQNIYHDELKNSGFSSNFSKSSITKYRRCPCKPSLTQRYIVGVRANRRISIFGQIHFLTEIDRGIMDTHCDKIWNFFVECKYILFAIFITSYLECC